MVEGSLERVDEPSQRGESHKRTSDCLGRTDDRATNSTKRHRKEMGPACARVLATTELLEAVLLQLPMCDLLFAQGVSKRFDEVIAGSLAIQRALFFEPEAVDESVAGEKPVPRLTNQLLTLHSLLKTSNVAVVTNKNGEAFAFGTYNWAPPHILWMHNIDRTDEVRGQSERRRRCFPTGSWRRMFFTQLPGPVKVKKYDEHRVEETSILTAKRLGELWQPHCYGSGECFTGTATMNRHGNPRVGFDSGRTDVERWRDGSRARGREDARQARYVT